jgi:formylglycine-generating enzyme required for sulfatase activity
MRSLRCFTILAVFGALALAQQARGQIVRRPAKPVGNRWALLIGVEDYIQLEKLHYCGADMRALRDQLVACGFPARQITLLEDKAADNKYRPFKSAIERQLDLALKMVERGDLLVVGFSGHGVHIGDKSYLCPLDARLRDTASLVCVETLYQRLSKCPAALKVALVDACRDDPRPGGDKGVGPAPELEPLGQALERPPEGIYCLTSCAPGETSKEDPKLEHGVFMHFVLQGLRGAADVDHRGKVSLLELCRYATTETKLYVRDKYNESQRPSYKMDATDDFDIARVARTITNSIGMKLVPIPSGEYLMLAPPQYGGLGLPEDFNFFGYKPRRVKITSQFYLGMHEVTVGQFREFVDDTHYKTSAEKEPKRAFGINQETGELMNKPECTWRNPGFAQNDDHPGVMVSADDAAEFCKWLSRKENRIYRLPSEVEWTYAYNAGRTTRLFDGVDPEKAIQVGNVADAVAKERFQGWKCPASGRDGYVFTAPVGRFKPNAWGLYDMDGNVEESCTNLHYCAEKPTDFNPYDAKKCRAVRMCGNSFMDGAGAACCWDSDRGTANRGFRVLYLP